MSETKRKRRSESYFGLHFDFHCSPRADGSFETVGATLREEEIREICRLLKPDFLQIDCKGHPGWASYPSACGNANPLFAGDPLALWRKVTSEEGVALYMHYSGVIDNKYLSEHPEQGCLHADGTRDKAATRTAGCYVDDLLIPQLSELAEKYGVDGVWVDGDCWGSQVDFDPETLAAFEKEKGISLEGKLPANPEDAYYEEYREYCRELFRRYVRHYVDTLHAKCPTFQVASNWSYTDHMEEAVSSRVDFISGDLNPWDAFNSARYAGRAIAQQQYTWDLMSWNFRSDAAGPITTVKHPIQILQEAAAVISLGGGFQNYITQYRDGSPRMEQIRAMKALADFMRPREAYCFRGKAVHQAALLLSTYDRHKECNQTPNLYTRMGCEKIMGMTSLLCDAGQSLEILSEHTLQGHAAEYPLLCVPQLYEGLAPETVEELLAYAREGGSLLLVGEKTLRLFAAAGAPVTLGESLPQGVFTVDGESFGTCFATVPVQGENMQVFAKAGLSARDALEPMAGILPYGKGKLAVIGMDIGSAWQKYAQYLHLNIMKPLLSGLYTPIAAVESARGDAEITLLEKDGTKYLQIVNAGGNHRSVNIATEDHLPPLEEVRLALRLPAKPTKLVLRPAGKELPFTWEEGVARVTVDAVPIHEILEIQ